MTKICICFFGVISRSLPHTIDSINTNIFNVLKESGISYDVYVHNMKVNKFESTTSKNDKVDNLKDCCKLLKCDYFSETNQIDFDEKNLSLFRRSWKYGFNFGFTKLTFKNAIRQLHSIKQVTKLWESKNKQYDFYIYLRPDLKYTTKINIDQILQYINNNHVLLSPYWGRWYNGLNDRIYMGTKKVIKLFGNRIDEVVEIIEKRKKPYHPELFMRYTAQKYNIQIVDIDFMASRVKTSGFVVNEEEDEIKLRKQLKK